MVHMNIGIIGSGNVGGTLGKRWAQGGHSVVFSARNPDSDELKELVRAAGPNARAANPAAAVADAQVVLLATPWTANQQALSAAGDLSGKILIDATNPLKPDFSGMDGSVPTSGAEQAAQWAPGALVVKAFNTVGSNIMANPLFGDTRPVLFYCGDNAAAKQTVHQLAVELGFDPHDAGPLKQARTLEYFGLLWISLAAFYGYGREIAFQFLRR